MHRGEHGGLILSPTDLVGHMACPHLTQLDRRAALGALQRPAGDEPLTDVLRLGVDDRRERERDRLVADGRSVVEIPRPGHDVGSLRAAEAATVAAMRQGAAVVFRPTLFDGRWCADPAFLLRVETPTDLGPWGYEVADTTDVRWSEPDAFLALCSSAEQVTRIQGAAPEEVVVVAAGDHHRVAFAGAAGHHRAAKHRVEAAVVGGDDATYPVRVPHCAICPWEDRCNARRRDDGHLSLVAGLRPDMVPGWEAVGVTDVGGLAASPVGEPVPGLDQDVADRLRHQAQLQLRQLADGRVHHELLVVDRRSGSADDRAGEPEPGEEAVRRPRGLAALPAPSPGDLFFDIEGDPWVGEHGLEYLFGLVGADPADPLAEPGYHSYWAHTSAEEQRAVEQVVDLVTARIAVDPAMHVYHFASYEVAVLGALSARYGTRGADLERLLGAGVFVDLHRVVREGVLVSQDGYGLKKLEPLYFRARRGPLADGGASVCVYEEWRVTGEQRLLDELAAYNELDCRSTLGLRGWLEGRRAELEDRLGAPIVRPAPEAAASAVSVPSGPQSGGGPGR